MSVFDRLVALGQPRGAQWTLRPSGRFEPRHPEYIWEGPATPAAARQPYAAAVDDEGDATDADEPSGRSGRDRPATRLRPVEAVPGPDDRNVAGEPRGPRADGFADAVAELAPRAAAGAAATGAEPALDVGAEREGRAHAVARERPGEASEAVPDRRSAAHDPFAMAAVPRPPVADGAPATPAIGARSADAGRPWTQESAPMDSRGIDPHRIGEAVLAALRDRGLVGGAARAEPAAGQTLPAGEALRTVVGIGDTATSAGGGEIRVSIDRVSIVPPAAPARADRTAPPGPAAPSRLAAFLDERGRAAR